VNGYDRWLTAAPDASFYPLVCTMCREHVFANCEDRYEQPHCTDEDTGEVYGTLVVDESWEDEDDA